MERFISEGLGRFPGYLGYMQEGREFVIAIHADWPMYPCPAGGGHALFDLVMYPQDTRFVQLDDIDRCLLLHAQGMGRSDPWSGDAYHVAAWHSDLLKLSQTGLLAGVVALTGYEWELRRWDGMARKLVDKGFPEDQPLERVFAYDNQGNRIEFARPTPPECVTEDDGPWCNDPHDFAGVAVGDAISVTSKGWTTALDHLASALSELPSPPRVRRLVELELFDTAIRELSVMFEGEMRSFTGTNSYGMQLVEELYRHMLDQGIDGGWPSSYAKALRGRLRATMKSFATSSRTTEWTCRRPAASHWCPTWWARWRRSMPCARDRLGQRAQDRAAGRSRKLRITAASRHCHSVRRLAAIATWAAADARTSSLSGGTTCRVARRGLLASDGASSGSALARSGWSVGLWHPSRTNPRAT